MLPIDPGVEIDVREHAMIVATASLTYSFEKLPGLKATLAAGSGMYLDRFVAAEQAGTAHPARFGNVFERTLGRRRDHQMEPGGFLYKESTVAVETVTHKLTPEGDSGAASPGQAAKSLAHRGLAGLRAAKALRKGGPRKASCPATCCNRPAGC